MPLFVQIFCFVCFAAGVNLVLHEIAHAGAAWLLGFRVFDIRIGSGRKVFRFQIGKCRIFLGLIPFLGLVTAFPRSDRFLRLRMLAFVAAGPLANCLVIWGTMRWLRYPLAVSGRPEWMETAGIFLVMFAGYSLLTSLWPSARFRYGATIESDGAQLFKIPFYDRAKRSRIVANYFLIYGSRCWESGETVRALRWFERAARQPPSDFLHQLLLRLAYLYSENGRVDRAREIYHRLLMSPHIPDRSPFRRDAADGLACLSIYCQRADLLTEGKSVITDAIAEHPECITLKGTLGGILFELGEIEESRRVLREVLEKSSAPLDRAISAAYLALISAREGDAVRRREYVWIAAAVLPVHAVVKRLLSTLPASQDEPSGTSK